MDFIIEKCICCVIIIINTNIITTIFFYILIKVSRDIFGKEMDASKCVCMLC